MNDIKPGVRFQHPSYGRGRYAQTLEVVKITDDGPFGVKCRRVGSNSPWDWQFIGLKTLQSESTKIVGGGK